MAAHAAARSSPALVLDRYRPLRPLGTGGSGSVWLAHDELTGDEVALKVVARGGRAGDRAQREAEVALRLRHPACQRASEVGSDGRHVYIAYEYVPGTTLRQAMREGRIDDRAAVEVAVQVLEGLAHAHRTGVVHRDVKPANVLLVEGPAIRARLLDFGLALVDGADPLTAAGDVPGTLAYISPERLNGSPGTPAGDVWSVGVLLWEALAGWHPFWAPSLHATAEKIRAGAPPLETARPDLPRPLLAAVDGALARNPDERPAPAELAKRLRKAWPPRERGTRPGVARTAEQVVPAALAGLLTGLTTAALPFFPGGWAPALAVVATALAYFAPWAGAAFALAAPVLPLGNISRGLALLYAALALAWLAAHRRRPRQTLLFFAGPLLGFVWGYGLLPLATQPLRDPVRRALHAAVGVLLAGVAAGLLGHALPFAGTHPGLEIAGERSPVAAARALMDVLAASPAFALEALAIALVAAALPYARRFGLRGIAVFAAGALAVTIVPAPGAAVFMAPAILATAGLLAGAERARR